MAIKFSQFVVQTDASTLSHIVGYDGVDNIQITPTNFLNSLLTGTAGQVLYYDTTGVAGENAFFWDNTNKRLGIGTTNPIEKLQVVGQLISSGSSSTSATTGVERAIMDLSNYSATDHSARFGHFRGVESAGAGQLRLYTDSVERLRIDASGNVGIGTATPSSKLEVDGDMSVTPGGVILLPDSSFLRFGTSSDATIYHDATDTYFKNFTGDLIIQNNKDDKDIIFQSDNGSGGLDTYYRIDGSAHENSFFKQIHLYDNVKAVFGASADLNIVHDGADSVIQNNTGDLEIQNRQDDGDIVFKSDDGSGGVATYFYLDGGLASGGSLFTRFPDNSNIGFGDSNDLRIYHNGINSNIENFTGNLQIINNKDDGDIIFRSDNGSGGTAEYYKIDGGSVLNIFYKDVFLGDNVKSLYGNSSDLQIYHDSANSIIKNDVGNLTIRNDANDKDIELASDDGSGGVAVYFYLDGSDVMTRFDKRLRMSDAVGLQLGSGGNFEMYHFNGVTTMDNFTGNLSISNQKDDGDIIFQCDDGSGGVTTYFLLDGSLADGTNKFTRFPDNSRVVFGTASDLQIFHNGTASFINNNTGDLNIANYANDKDIRFFCDDGSGGVVEYFRLSGSTTKIQINKEMQFFDNVNATFGNAADLKIYHDGNNSYIQDSGTGSLKILAQDFDLTNAAESASMIRAIDGAQVELYYGGSKKLETKSTGINIQGVTEYANNTAAVAAGLVVGDVYRTGDDLKIVH
jgi:hypothetical protein